MSFTTIPTVSVGDGVSVSRANQVKTNLDDLNTRVSANSSQLGDVVIIGFNTSGPINDYSIVELETLAPFFADKQYQIKSVLVLLTEESSGTQNLEIDVQKSTNSGVSYSTILSTTAKLTAMTVGTRSTDVGEQTAVLLTDPYQINVDDILRVTVLDKFSGQMNFAVYVTAKVVN